MADVVRDLGFDGLDVTTRTGGTIAPEERYRAASTRD